MVAVEMTVQDIFESYQSWMLGSKPIKITKFDLSKLCEGDEFELYVLFFQPSAENLPDSDKFTYIATAGFSRYKIQGCENCVELVLRVDGCYSLEECENLGKHLAKLAFKLCQENTCLTPNLIIRNISLPIFDLMNCILFTHWGFRTPEYLPELSPPVMLLSLKPMYESEIEIIEEIGLAKFHHYFSNQRIRWYYPKRDPIILKDKSGEIEPKRNKGVMINIPHEIEGGIQNIWCDIEEWYSKNSPNLLASLNAGISSLELSELESLLGISLPNDYKCSLKIHNGEVYFHSYSYLSAKSVTSTWKVMNQLYKEGVFDDRELVDNEGQIIDNAWWHPNWIPFAKDSMGNQICIDMAPGINGVVGQIIYLEMEEGPLVAPYRSFFEWLMNYRDGLYNNIYEITEEGFLYEK